MVLKLCVLEKTLYLWLQRTNLNDPKEINPEYLEGTELGALETLTFWPPDVGKNCPIRKEPGVGKPWWQEKEYRGQDKDGH